MTLEQARQLLGWSVPKLAKKAGQKPGAIYDLEHGRNLRPSYVLVMSIFKALQRGGLRGIDIEDIFPLPALPDTPPAQKTEGPDAATGDRPRGKQKRVPGGKHKASVEPTVEAA